MKRKILFWIDDGLIQFGISSFLQKKYEHELYAIIDTNYVTRNFFKTQKIVKFRKFWLYRDYLSSKPHQIDFDYLKYFEEKYMINLWQLAYSERRFYRFNEYHKFTYDEILSVTEDECKIFESVINEVDPDFLCISVTDLHRNFLFCELCRSRGIKILMFNPTRLSNRAIISEDYDKIDGFDKTNVNFSSSLHLSPDDLKNYIKKKSAYEYIEKGIKKKFSNQKYKLSKFDIVRRHLHFLFKVCNDDYRKFYENWGHTKIKFLTKSDFILPFIIKRWKMQRFLDNNAVQEVDLSKPFVYYPLHHEPERTILFSSPYFTNQLEVIRDIAKSIPVGFQLYVKEHFSMKLNAWRNSSFYKEILDLPNVVLIHPNVKPELLMENCQLVTTITGSSAFEAGFYEKPSIIFGETSYDYLPFVNRLKNREELLPLVKKCLNTKYNYSTLNHYIELYEKNSFEFDRLRLMQEIATQLHGFNGMTKEVKITDFQMQNFLDNHKEEFETLTSEYMKKIEKNSN
ncbi:MAG: capsular biosynthesis protein [Nitrosopumilus sp.]|uniref:capsular polysaccharide export protein, LipB/KpsS family n=1 Tax=Nitrosopumilus sp. TaxID=2024843 RepID=UPI00247CECF0|nr:hypothetical protein [Nitrosopumilus sp.]MCV0393558.1 capsular biosynthesis protein [Nitrosopumilus sp.]